MEGIIIDTKSKILTAAIALFAAKGYEKTTMRIIAERVGISSAGIYYFFPSKESLLEAVFAEFSDNFSKYKTPPEVILQGARDRPLEETLAMLFYTFGPPQEQQRMMTISRVIFSLLYVNPAAQALYERVVIADALDYGRQVLKGLAAQGLIHDTSPYWVSYIFQSFAVAMFKRALRHADDFPQNDMNYQEGIRFLCASFASLLAREPVRT